MASIAILVSQLAIGNGGMRLEGIAQAEGFPGVAIPWETMISWSSSATAANQACKDAAIAAAAAMGITVEAGDNKLIFAGAQTP